MGNLKRLREMIETEAAREALLSAAQDAAERGDIGKEGGPEAWEWLRYFANRHYPED